MISDLGIIFQVYLVSLGIQFLVWPWVSRVFKKLADGGWALGRVVSLLSIGLPIWFVGHVWPVNTDLGVAIMILLLLLIGLRSLRAGIVPPKRIPPRRSSRKNAITVRGEIRRASLRLCFTSRRKLLKTRILKMILVEECLFFIGLVGLSLVRGFQPDILGLEKFMDFGFIKQYLVSSSLPVKDMWLAGESINYYSFGHFLASILVRVWGVGLETGYNLMLAFILGTSLALSFSIVINLGGGIVGGLMGALLTCLGGNSHAIWYFLKNKGFSDYWYADATRFIENTIHEYPGYSFVVSDLHAHVLGIPIVLAFILVLIGLWKNQSYLKGVILGVLMGVMAMTNTWDVAVYGLLLIVFGLIWLLNKKIGVWKLFKLGLIVGGVAEVVALLWFINFKSFSSGVSLVDGRSPLWQLGVLWGGHLVVVLVALVLVARKKVKKSGGKNLMVVALGVTALLLLLIPEVLYIKDIYTTHQRANTMFKLTYQGFIMMSLLFGWVVGQLLLGFTLRIPHLKSPCRTGPLKRQSRPMKDPSDPFRRILLIVVVVLWGGFMSFPVQSFSSYYGDFKDYKGLDGLAWLKRDGNRWEMIKYLEENKDGKNLVEAVGDSYSRLNSVSAFSGTPTVLGWKVHEWLWRGGYAVVRERGDLVKDFYEGKRGEVLDMYDVGWIVVGLDEKKEYEVDENKLLKLGEVVLSGKDGYLIKVTD